MKQEKFDSYVEYKKTQEDSNKSKLLKDENRHCVSEDEIVSMATYLNTYNKNIQFGICHGVRNGWEVKKFRYYIPNANIIGTDISETATHYGAIQWDFHDANPAWVGEADFIFSNSLDHSYDPEGAINTWFDCLKPHGVLFIGWQHNHGESGINKKMGDIFGASLGEYQNLVNKNHKVDSIINVSKGNILIGRKHDI